MTGSKQIVTGQSLQSSPHSITITYRGVQKGRKYPTFVSIIYSQKNIRYHKNETQPIEVDLPKVAKSFLGFQVTFNVIGQLVKTAMILLLLIGSAVMGTGIGYFAYLVKQADPPSKEEMTEQLNHFDQQSTLYYANHEPIANVRSDLVRTLSSLDNISPSIIDGFISTEDEYFYEHPGIVPKAILRATLGTLLSGSGTGGSTITQQIVKQQMLTHDVTFLRKANEILLALRVEKYFTKDEILTAYLNVSPFGRNNHGENIAGIYQAAEGIFGIEPSKVNLNQAAFLAGLPQDPYSYTPYNQYGELREDLSAGVNRMKEVLYRMYRNEKLSKAEYEAALEYDITKDFLAGEPREEEHQSYLYQAVMHGAIEILMRRNLERDGLSWETVWEDVDLYNQYYFAANDEVKTGGYHIYSTIDQEIYEQLQRSAVQYNDSLGVPYDGIYIDPDTGEEIYYVETVQTGLVVIDNPTGKVLGFVAGTDYESNQIDHAFMMRRSPGSTIKPMAVYAPAIEHNLINPATIIPDTPFIETFEDGSTWQPTNYGNYISNEFMNVRTALYKSDNLPAVRIYNEMKERGIPIIQYLEKMGFNTVDSYTEEDTQNLAFALGGVTTGPTVFEETRAFTTFANKGEYIPGYYIEKIEDAFGNPIFEQNHEATRVFAEDTNYLVLDILRDTLKEGTGRTISENLLVPGDWIAKTGISENSKDIWVIASTPQLTIGSWIGYDSKYSDYTIDVNDGYGLESVRSQIYWSKIVNDLYEIRPEIFGTSLKFTQPSSVKKQQIVDTTGTLPGSVSIGGRNYTISQPLREDLFKTSSPAPQITYNFMFGASEDEVARRWQEIVAVQRQKEDEKDESTQESESEDKEESSDEHLEHEETSEE